MEITKEIREKMIAELKGRTIENVEYVEASPEAGPMSYWVLTFPDGSETCIKFMAELV